MRSTNNENAVERNRHAFIFFYYGDCGEKAYFFGSPTTELDISITIPDFESYIQSFMNSNLYQRTLYFTYPETGLWAIIFY